MVRLWQIPVACGAIVANAGKASEGGGGEKRRELNLDDFGRCTREDDILMILGCFFAHDKRQHRQYQPALRIESEVSRDKLNARTVRHDTRTYFGRSGD